MKKFLAILLVLLLASAAAASAETWTSGYLTKGGWTEQEIWDWNVAYYNQSGITEFSDGTSFADWHVQFFDDLSSALLALQRGGIQDLVLPRATAEYVMRQNPGTYMLSEECYEDYFAYSMATLSENTQLFEKLNGAISALLENGTLDALKEQYFSGEEDFPEAVQLPYTEGAETIRVLVTGDLPPMDYITAEGTAAGFNIALLSAISEELGVNIELVQANSGSRVINLTSGNADALFWIGGTRTDTDGAFDFTIDAPEGVAVTNPYITQDDVWLMLNTAE